MQVLLSCGKCVMGRFLPSSMRSHRSARESKPYAIFEIRLRTFYGNKTHNDESFDSVSRCAVAPKRRFFAVPLVSVVRGASLLLLDTNCNPIFYSIRRVSFQMKSRTAINRRKNKRRNKKRPVKAEGMVLLILLWFVVVVVLGSTGGLYEELNGILEYCGMMCRLAECCEVPRLSAQRCVPCAMLRCLCFVLFITHARSFYSYLHYY